MSPVQPERAAPRRNEPQARNEVAIDLHRRDIMCPGKEPLGEHAIPRPISSTLSSGGVFTVVRDAVGDVLVCEEMLPEAFFRLHPPSIPKSSPAIPPGCVRRFLRRNPAGRGDRPGHFGHIRGLVACAATLCGARKGQSVSMRRRSSGMARTTA